MSTSLLYHAFGLRGYRYVRTSHVEGMTTFQIEPHDKQLCCSACGSQDVIRRGSVDRVWRTLPIGRRPTLIHLEVPRLGCRQCGVARQAELGFAEYAAAADVLAWVNAVKTGQRRPEDNRHKGV